MASWNTWAQKSATRLVNWWTRRRRIGAILLGAGGVLAGSVLVANGITLSFTRQTEQDQLIGWFTTGTALPPVLMYVVIGIACPLMVVGATILVFQWGAERRAERRSAVIAIELRGLIDTSDRPLMHAIPSELVGERIDAHVDVRSRMEAGGLQQAFSELQGLPGMVRRLRGQRERGNVRVVVGGVLQVPFLLYAGVLLDDEGSVTQLDWDRKAGAWRELDDVDDGERFKIEGLSTLPNATQRVVLSVSASYATDAVAISAAFGSLPVVSLALARPLPDSLWSEEKQAALAAQFLEMLAKLGNKGVTSVDLVLAAPSSLVLRIGRAYDPRNLPTLRCYQYQKNMNPPYPWYVQISGPGEAAIQKLDHVSSEFGPVLPTN